MNTASPEISAEFFPVQTPDAADELARVRRELAVLRPAFYSVTYGAGGSTQEHSFATIERTQQEGTVAACPHLTCIGATRDKIRAILERFRALGIRRIVTLRGDLPSGVIDPGEFRYANELIEFIRRETGDEFHLTVAAYPEWHPQARSPQADIDAFCNKARAGANAAITQFFYNPDAYFHFLDSIHKQGVDLPILPGIMPILSFSKLSRFADACGAELPRWMRRKFESFGDDAAAVRAFALDVVTALCEKLLAGGAPGLHFYTMNRAESTLEICRRLGLNPPADK